MKLLVFLDPLTARRNPVESEIFVHVAREVARILGDARGGEAFFCAPGSEGEKLRARVDSEDALKRPSVDVQAGALLEAVQSWFPRTASANQAVADYYRGVGPAYEALIEFLETYRSSLFDFDAVLSCQPGLTFDRAASRLGFISARLNVWPQHGRRWRYSSFIRCRNAEGLDPLEHLALDHLRGLDLIELPASTDQRLLGGQELVNPYECQFLPLDEAVQRAFRPDRKTALVVLQSGEDGDFVADGAYAEAGEFLGRVLPPLLEAGWNSLLMGDTGEGRALASGWLDRPGVFLIDPVMESSMKDERRKVLALLAQCDLLVTDSSSMGLEAMIYERPVCVLGRPEYALAGIFPSLEGFLGGSFNPEDYRDSASLLRAFLFRAFGTPYFGWRSPRKMAERAVAEIRRNREWADRPTDWVRSLVQEFGERRTGSWYENLRERQARLERPLESQGLQ